MPRENETNAKALKAFLQLDRGQFDLNAESFEHIGAAAARRDAAIAVLHDGRPACSEDEHDRGGDIEKIEAIATRAAHIQHRARQVFRIDERINRAIDQLLNETDNLLNAFPFAMQRRQKIGLHCVIGRVRKKQRHGEADIAGIQIRPIAQLGDERLHHAAFSSISRNQPR